MAKVETLRLQQTCPSGGANNTTNNTNNNNVNTGASTNSSSLIAAAVADFNVGSLFSPQQNYLDTSTSATSGRNFGLLTTPTMPTSNQAPSSVTTTNTTTSVAASASAALDQPVGPANNNSNFSSVRPVKMKFSAIWDVDKTPTNAVPRLCRLNVTRLELKPSAFAAPGDLPPSTVLLAVKIQGRRRTLRSSEIALNPSALNAVEVNLEFSLQYPHFLKRSNHIEIMLQRKKHYKNRTIPGYKTLAIARLDMAEVLQRPTTAQDEEQQLDLYAPAVNVSPSEQEPSQTVPQRHVQVVASLRLSCAASQPLPKPASGRAQGEASGDDDVSSGIDDNGNAGTESDDVLDDDRRSSRRRHRPGKEVGSSKQTSSVKASSSSKNNFKSMAIGQQTKFKQKIVSLLKKMKVGGASSGSGGAAASHHAAAHHGLVSPTTAAARGDYDYYLDEEFEEEGGGAKGGRRKSGGKKGRRNSFPPHAGNEQSLEDLEAEIENWAPPSDIEDSEADGVSLAVTVQPSETTPKPSLRPFFFSDLRLSSEQLPFLLDELSGTATKASSSKTNPLSIETEQKQKQTSDRRGSNDRELSNTASGNNNNNNNNNNISNSPPPHASSSSPSKQPEKSQQQQQLQPQVSTSNLPSNLALSPGIQLEHIFQTSTEMPSHVVLVFDASLTQLAKLCASLPDGLNVVCASSLGDVDVFFAEITRLLQKFTKASMNGGNGLKLVVCGSSDAFFAAVTQSYVDRFSSRLPDWTGLVRLLPVPLVFGSAVGQLLGAVSYHFRVFAELVQALQSSAEVLLQLQDALTLPVQCLSLFSIPIGEVLLTIRGEKMPGDLSGSKTSRQIVLPFICDVQVNIVRSLHHHHHQQSLQHQPSIQQQQQPVIASSLLSQSGVQSSESQQQQVPTSSSFASSAAWQSTEQQQSSIDNDSNANTTTNNVFSAGSPTLAAATNSAWTTTSGSSTTPAVARVFDRLMSPSGLHSTSAAATGGLVATTASPDVPSSSSSAAFEINVDYWLETSSGNNETGQTVNSGIVSSSLTGGERQANSTGQMSSKSSSSVIISQSGAAMVQQQSLSASAASSSNVGIVGTGGASSSASSSVNNPASSGSSRDQSSLNQQQGQMSQSSSQQQQQQQQQNSGRNYNLRGSYRQMVVTRSLVPNSQDQSLQSLQPNAMTMIMSARDKKIKKIWLPRKSRDSLGAGSSKDQDAKGQTVVDSVSRLVCTVKSSSSGHKVIVCVDGVEFTGVKFFQISPAWHSHVKSFPVFVPTTSASSQQQQQQYSIC